MKHKYSGCVTALAGQGMTIRQLKEENERLRGILRNIAVVNNLVAVRELVERGLKGEEK